VKKRNEAFEQIIKKMQYEKDAMEEKLEAQEKLLDLLYDDLEKKNKDLDDLKKEIMKETMSEEEVERFNKQKKEFAVLCREMDRKSRKRNEAFEKLKAGIKALEQKFKKPKQRCSFEWKCKNVVCRFDHSFLNHKINVPPSFTSLTRFSCSYCDKTFKSNVDRNCTQVFKPMLKTLSKMKFAKMFH
jgi:hypothetical protein